MKSYILGNDGYNYTSGYFTSDKWIGESKLVVARSLSADIGQISRRAEIVVLDLDTFNTEIICGDLTEWWNYAVFGSYVYYVTQNELKRYNTENGMCEVLYEASDNIQIGRASCRERVCQLV